MFKITFCVHFIMLILIKLFKLFLSILPIFIVYKRLKIFFFKVLILKPVTRIWYIISCIEKKTPLKSDLTGPSTFGN